MPSRHAAEGFGRSMQPDEMMRLSSLWHGLSLGDLLMFSSDSKTRCNCSIIKQFLTVSHKIKGMETALISRPLTAKQSRFIDEYMVDMNGAAAAARCGYSKKTSRAIACELLTKPDLQAELQARQAADATRLSIQREDVLNGLLEAASMAKLQCDPAGMVAAWKQVGLLMGYYSPERIKVDMSVQGQTVVNQLERLSDAELLALMASGGGAAAH